MSSATLTVPPAFDLLHHQLDACLEQAQEQIAQAARQGAYDEASRLLQRARELTELRKALNAIEKRFGQLVDADAEDAPGLELLPDAKRIRRGLKTPQEAYRVPILQALVELGGGSDLHPVLDRVYELMKDQLNDYDHTVLPSDDATPRWRNTAQWERSSLREEGLIRDDTPRAIWEITEKGREWLRDHQATVFMKH